MADDFKACRIGDWQFTLGAMGGQIIEASWRGHPVLMPGQPGRAAADQHAGCFPLVPFSNRIRGGTFHFAGRTITLPPPDYAEPHALHGRGWRARWELSSNGPDAARMTFRHARGAWPWRYMAEQIVSVNGEGALEVSLSLVNMDEAPMPAGIGLHPYFARPDGFRLTAVTQGRWATDPAAPGLPTRREAAPVDLGTEGLDHCFLGWDGHADFGGRDGLQLTLAASGALRNLVIYTPPGKPYFCLEPVSHVNNAVHLDGLSADEQMTVLQPRDALIGTMTLSARLLEGTNTSRGNTGHES